MLRYGTDFIHNQSGIILTSSHEVTDIFASIKTDLDKLVNRTDCNPEVEAIIRNTSIANITGQFFEITQTKFEAIFSSLTNNSDVERVKHELVKLDGNIRKLLKEDSQLNRFPTEKLEIQLTETQ